MIELIEKNKDQIVLACRHFGVQRLEVFGSAISGAFDENSDVDFLAEFMPAEGSLLDRYLALADELERVLGKKVDLITPGSLRNPYFKQAVESASECLYAA